MCLTMFFRDPSCQTVVQILGKRATCMDLPNGHQQVSVSACHTNDPSGCLDAVCAPALSPSDRLGLRMQCNEAGGFSWTQRCSGFGQCATDTLSQPEMACCSNRQLHPAKTDSSDEARGCAHATWSGLPGKLSCRPTMKSSITLEHRRLPADKAVFIGSKLQSESCHTCQRAVA